MVPQPDSADRRTADGDRRVNIFDLIDQNNQKHDDAHRRIREDLRELESRLVDGLKPLNDHQHALDSRVGTLETSPVDASKMMFTPRVVFAIIAVVLSVSVGMWAQNSGVRSDVRNILTSMESDRRVSDSNAKLLELNNTTIKAALADNTREMRDALIAITKRQDLLTLQYNELNSQITRLTARGEK